MSAPDLDAWLPEAAVRVAHRALADADPEHLWAAARETRLSDTRVLGRLIRWRIPGIAADTAFGELFCQPPFVVLEQGELWLLSGIVGRIWTIRRDYPQLVEPEEFRAWSRPGTVRVLFANWVERAPGEGVALCSETRVQAFGAQARIGLASLRPLIGGFQPLIRTDAMAVALRAARAR